MEQLKQASHERNTSHLLNFLEFQVDFPIENHIKSKVTRDCYAGGRAPLQHLRHIRYPRCRVRRVRLGRLQTGMSAMMRSFVLPVIVLMLLNQHVVADANLQADASDPMQLRISATIEIFWRKSLCYCARPIFFMEQLTWVAEDHNKLLHHLPKPKPDGRSELYLAPLELLDRLVSDPDRSDTFRVILGTTLLCIPDALTHYK